MKKYKRVFTTGACGFIGYYLSKSLLEEKSEVIGFDNINDYYDPNLKYSRLEELKRFPNFIFVKGNLSNWEEVEAAFAKYSPDIVVNLAAQAGVRYSLKNPRAYLESNVDGFFNILEGCKKYSVSHLIFASSSSVYGNQNKVPFSVRDSVDHPVSFYAATKKSNELMAYTYSHLYHIPMTGLRFFTVYGPFGRPDMAYFSFTQKILNGQPIKIFNGGEMYRDFTYIDDIIYGIRLIMDKSVVDNSFLDPYKIYNIGKGKPDSLVDFIEILESVLGMEAQKEYLPMQPGDVYQTYADISDMERDFNFKPQVCLKDGLGQFINWYVKYYHVNL